MYYHGSWTQWFLGIESHMGHQHVWGQRSFKGHLGLLTFWLKFLKKWSVMSFMGLGHNDPWVDRHIHSNRYGVKSNITMIAKVCDCKSRRDSWFKNRLVLFIFFDLCHKKVVAKITEHGQSQMKGNFSFKKESTWILVTLGGIISNII